VFCIAQHSFGLPRPITALSWAHRGFILLVAGRLSGYSKDVSFRATESGKRTADRFGSKVTLSNSQPESVGTWNSEPPQPNIHGPPHHHTHFHLTSPHQLTSWKVAVVCLRCAAWRHMGDERWLGRFRDITPEPGNNLETPKAPSKTLSHLSLPHERLASHALLFLGSSRFHLCRVWDLLISFPKPRALNGLNDTERQGCWFAAHHTPAIFGLVGVIVLEAFLFSLIILERSAGLAFPSAWFTC
jgi:hypothetical protein